MATVNLFATLKEILERHKGTFELSLGKGLKVGEGSALADYITVMWVELVAPRLIPLFYRPLIRFQFDAAACVITAYVFDKRVFERAAYSTLEIVLDEFCRQFRRWTWQIEEGE